MKRTVPAIVGGAVGIAGAAVAAGLVAERRSVSRQRSRVDPRSAAALGRLASDRHSRVQTSDGLELYVEEVGPLDAPLTVVFVHGFCLTLDSFHFQRVAVSEHFGDDVRLVFYDQRSHGRSDRDRGGRCSLRQLGEDLGAVIDAVAPQGPVALVGHSMGGMTIMALADQRPELLRGNELTAARAARRGDRSVSGRIGSVALINTSSGELKTVTLGLPAFVARLQAPVLPMVLRRAAKNVQLVEFGRSLGKDIAWTLTKRLSFASKDVDPAVVAFCTRMISGTPVDVVADFYPALMAHDGSLGLMNLQHCTVLVIGSDKDALTPLRHAEAIAAALPNAQLVTVNGTGHLLMLERPGAVDPPLLALLDGALADAREAPSRRHRSASR